MVKYLMRVLQEEYWEIPVRERLRRLKAILPTKVSNNDFIYEVTEVF